MAQARALDVARQARTDVYRKLVLEAAERHFAEGGYEATRIQQIAESAGLSVGTLYGIFPGKQELYREIQTVRGAELLESVRPALEAMDDADADPVALLLTGVRAYVRFLVAHPSYLRMQLRDVAAWAVGPDPAAAAQFETWRTGQELTTRIFARGVATGRVVDEEPALLARTMIAMQQVHLAYWMEQGATGDPDALIDGILRQFRRSFLVDPAPGAPEPPP